MQDFKLVYNTLICNVKCFHGSNTFYKIFLRRKSCSCSRLYSPSMRIFYLQDMLSYVYHTPEKVIQINNKLFDYEIYNDR